MPLEEYYPVIDDRSYDSLVEEARARIPRYTKEWTDFNDTDPGIVLIQLFSWLTEMQLFRLSQVPELNYLKFLEMLGIDLEPAKAATALITFPVMSTHSESSLIVPAKTQISSEKPDDEGRILFETDKAFTAIRSKLLNLLADDGFNFRDLSNDNVDSLVSFQPFGPAAAAEDAFMLGFDEALPEQTIHLQSWTPLKQGNTASAKKAVISPCFSNVESINTTQLAWEFWNGSEWRPLTLLKDDSAAFTRSGEIQLMGPESGLMVAETFGDISAARFWIRARITRSGFQEAPKIIALRTNTTQVTQAETIELEPVGGSNGEIDQVLRLRNSPVLAGSLELHVNEGNGFVPWEEVVDFFGSGVDDPHYILNRATGEIRFGDGKNGRVPVANARNRNNVRALIYRSGGGKRGNLSAGLISKLMNSVAGVQANQVSNLFESAGGDDEETLDAAIKRAPQAMKSQERAVTAEDYEQLAMLATNIARAKALPLYHPDYPRIDVPGTVSVIVVPDVEGAAPVPSEGTLQTVCAYLNERRLLTSELYVVGPAYKEVIVRVSIVANETADLAEIKSSALDNLDLYFHPLYGGEDSDPSKEDGDLERNGKGWPFGGDIYYSLLYRRLLFSGVKRIISLEIEVDGKIYPECRDITIDRDILLMNGSHEVDVSYEVEA